MKNQSRKRAVPLEQHKGRDSFDDRNGHIQQRKKSSSGSSDFSDFQLQSRQLNNDFTPFSKRRPQTANNKQEGKVRSKIQKDKQTIDYEEGLKSKHKQSHGVQSKHKQKKAEKLKQQDLIVEKTVPHLISFSEQKQKLSSLDGRGTKTKQRAQNQNDESLIREYDKKEFHDKSIAARQKERDQSQHNRSTQREKKLNENGMLECQGGVCFELNKADFVYKDDHPKLIKKKRRTKVTPGLGNSNEQILRRRQIAFRYGEFIRHRTFGRF